SQSLAIVRQGRNARLQLDFYRRRADSEYRQTVDLSGVITLGFRITKIDVVVVRRESDTEIPPLARRDELRIAINIDLPQPQAFFSTPSSYISDVLAVR